ncbi:ATP-binding cassette domain-containing protein [Lacticaseibacillus jixianensis]|uniref:ATP-binding cassette domain-containing protein n=1 Tax=Lacticaseibacillus jixianensis TaxID=2486012 RepID=A0ABW4B821_9LACO|nr:ABC transporter ATP-binding protein [Lacticaseibacillus jixianensis]
MWHLIGELVKPNRRPFVLQTVFSVFAALDGIAGPYFLGRFTDQLTAQAFSASFMTLVLWGGALLVILAASGGESYFAGRFRQGVNVQLRNRVVARAYAPGQQTVKASSYTAEALADVKQIEQDFVTSLTGILYCLLQGSLTLIFLLQVNWQLGLVFVALGFLPTIVPKLTARWLKNGTQLWQQANDRYTSGLTDTLNARPLFRHYQLVVQGLGRLSGMLRQSEAANFTMNMRQQWASLFVSALYAITTTGALAVGVVAVMHGQLTIGMLLTLNGAADRVVSPMITIVTDYNHLASSEPLVQRILRPVEATVPKLHFESERHSLIQFQAVTVGFDSPIMRPIDLVITAGTKLLIQGPSGVGKSTLVQVLLHDRQPLRGQVIYSSQLAPEPLAAMTIVHQQPFIFADTLAYNLTLGRPITQERMFRLLRQVGLAQYATVEGLRMQLGSDGHQLSGGEEKRLELARALAEPKTLLVVDEALSGLDATAAAEINRLILNYPGAVIDIEHHATPTMRGQYSQVLDLTRYAIS